MAAKKKKNKVFNDRPRKVFRHYIGKSELAFSCFFIVFTFAMGAWFVLERDNYDPGERDISMEAMIASKVEDHLWEPPLQLWVEPGSRPAGGGGVSIDLGVFPPQMLGGGWSPASRVQVFDSTNLYEKIDGQETQYKAYGFELLHFLAIEDPEKGLDLNIELYDMGSFQNALGIFAAQRSAGSVVQQEGKAFLYLTEAGALGIVDKYYFKFTGNEDSDTIRNHALLVVNAFGEGLDDSDETPRAFMLLAGDLGIDFQDIEYVKEDVFQYDFAQDFWFGKQSGESPVKYYLHESAGEGEAAELFEMILEEHLYEYELVSRDGNNVVLKHEFLKTFLSLNQVGRFVYGLEDAPDVQAVARELPALADKVTEGMV